MVEKSEKDTGEMVDFSQKDIDAIGEIANISFGSASTVLSTLLNQPVNITTPCVEVVDLYDASDVEIPHVVLGVSYEKAIDVDNILVLKKEGAAVIADLMMMGTGEVDSEKELTELELSAVKEAMNQMMGNAATAMSQLFNDIVDISPPSIKVVSLKDEIENLTEERQAVVKISFDLHVGDFVHSKIVQIISIKDAKTMVNKLLGINEINKELIVTVEESEQQLSPQEKDMLGELCNIAIGSASTIMSTLLNKQVRIGTAQAEVISLDEIQPRNTKNFVINVDFLKGISASNTIVLTKEATLTMSDLMMGGTGENIEEDKELTDFEVSVVQEMANMMIGNAATAMSNMFDESVDITPPIYSAMEMEEMLTQVYGEKGIERLVQVVFDLDVEDLIHTKMVQFFLISEAKALVNRLIDLANPEIIVEEAALQPTEVGENQTITRQLQTTPKIIEDELLKDVEVNLVFIFGTKLTNLKEFLSYEENEIIELFEGVNEPVKMMINGVLIGYGELVNVNGHFGIRVLGAVTE